MEAALLIPVLLLFLALLVQPACVLYTHTVMQGAAAEGVRALATAYGGAANEETVRSFVLRRLQAVPRLSIFHVGGADAWEIDLSGSAETSDCSVSIKGSVELLPLAGAVATAFGLSSGRELPLSVSVEERMRPEWLEGGYSEWVGIWEGR